MIYRIFPIRDTVITNGVEQRQRQTGSNVGASETLEVFKLAGISGTIGTLGSSSLARTLMMFDVEALRALSASFIPSGSSYRLVLKHKTSSEELPYSFETTVQPLSSSWDEGRGIDDQQLSDMGVANWDKAKSNVWWTTPGGDLLSSYTASVTFDSGEEDLEANVTEMFWAWMTGALPNNGLVIRMSASLESDSSYVDYYTKKFYSRTSNFVDRRPFVEISWKDFVGDDRANMNWGRTGSLVVYNIIAGAFTNFSDRPIVDIRDKSGTIATVTASYSGQVGIYSASISILSGTYSGSVFSDCWRLSGSSLFTGSFLFKTEGPTVDPTPPQLSAKIKNLQNSYVADDVVRFDVAFRRKGYLMPVLSTASAGHDPYIVERAYFSIENDATAEQCIAYGTGSTETTRLSYDGSGNYFKFYMRNLHAGNVYRIVFLIDERGYRQVIDSGFRFKVV